MSLCILFNEISYFAFNMREWCMNVLYEKLLHLNNGEYQTTIV